MLQANSPSTVLGSPFTAPSTLGRPKRGTPDYAATVRSQIARLAAMHAAALAEAPPVTPQSVLLVTDCPRVRQTVRDGLKLNTSVRLVEAESVEAGREAIRLGNPSLVLVDQSCQVLLAEAPVGRAVLIANAVPRSHDLPPRLAGMLARPLKAERVSRQVTEWLGQVR